MRGYYSIDYNGEKVEFFFKTWTLSRFCEKNGNMPLVDFFNLLGSNGLTLPQISDLLLCAVEYGFVKNKTQFPYTDFDACEWIDGLGGIGGTAFTELLSKIAEAVIDSGAKEGKKKAGR
jgi:hypothetical protein